MEKDLSYDEVFMAAQDKIAFLRESFKAVGCEGCGEKFMQIGASFYHGAAQILDEIGIDLEEISSTYVKREDVGPP